MATNTVDPLAALAALEQMTAAHAQRAELEGRMVKLGGQLQTPAEFAEWLRVVNALGLNFNACRVNVRPALYRYLMTGM